MSSQPSDTDVLELRKRARKHLERGAVTSSYGGDVEQSVALLNTALASELVCMLRYRHHAVMASGIHSESAKREFLEHANEEQEHAHRLAERIAIDSYRAMIEFFRRHDSTTRRLLEEILEKEEEHASDMHGLLGSRS
jgi:bacterioferritin